MKAYPLDGAIKAEALIKKYTEQIEIIKQTIPSLNPEIAAYQSGKQVQLEAVIRDLQEIIKC